VSLDIGPRATRALVVGIDLVRERLGKLTPSDLLYAPDVLFAVAKPWLDRVADYNRRIGFRERESAVLISRELASAFNDQIGHEFGASMQYISIAAHFQQRNLQLLAKLFFEQADEEKQHAMKFVKYLLDTKADLKIPALPAPTATFASAEAAVGAALKWEQEVTGQITTLMDLAMKQEDYLAQSFLQWFIDEQLEEVVKMDRLLTTIQQSGERNLLMVEAYLIHTQKAG
jgi:ferritin